MPFTQEELKDYEKKIRQLPLEELYEILEVLQKDPTSERIDIVQKRIAELGGSLETEQDSEESAAPPPKKWILAVLAIVETCFVAIMIMAKIKAEASPIGLLIDDAFLNNVARHEYYQILFDTFLIPTICIGAATGFYAYALYVQSQRIYSSKDYKKIVYPVCLAAMLILVSELVDLPSIDDEKSNIYIQTVVQKKERHYRISTNKYYLYFSNGACLKVSNSQYDNTKTGQRLYTIYQGKNIIKAMPMDRIVLKVHAQDLEKK